jgi:hypothetical protein
MTQIITLASGQTRLLPDDILFAPEITQEQALAQLTDDPLQKSLPHFISRIHGEIAQKKEELQAKVDQKLISEQQGWAYLIGVLFDAQAQIIEEQAKIEYVTSFEDELNDITNPFVRKHRERELEAEVQKKIEAFRQK